MCTSATAQSKHFERTGGSERVSNYTKKTRRERREQSPQDRREREQGGYTKPPGGPLGGPMRGAGERGRLLAHGSTSAWWDPWLSPSFLCGQVHGKQIYPRNATFGAHRSPGSSSSTQGCHSPSAFCPWKPSVPCVRCRNSSHALGHTVYQSLSGPFFFFFSRRRNGVRNTREFSQEFTERSGRIRLSAGTGPGRGRLTT